MCHKLAGHILVPLACIIMLQTARQLGGVWWLLTSIWFTSVDDELLPTIPNRADCRRPLLLSHLVSFEFLEDDRLAI